MRKIYRKLVEGRKEAEFEESREGSECVSGLRNVKSKIV